ncbi:MAG: TonB-dependent receptor [Nitrosomonas sp.]|nr:TonB-dependent receptor [Nitrosomonas sp.]
MKLFRIFFSWLAVTAGFCSSVLAEETLPALTLQPVTVTADPLGRKTVNIAQPASILKRGRLLTRDVRNIGEAVSQELGVSSSDFGPGAGRPVIRGLTGARVRVLEDGIGTMDVSTISPDHAVAAEPLFADQIEIFRGPSALMYGSGASGGVVNIVNRRILDYVPEAISGDLYGHYNSVADDFTGAFRLNAGRGDFAFHLDGLKRDTRDYDIPKFAAVDPEPGSSKGVLKNSAIQTENFSGGVSYIRERGYLGVAVNRLRNRYGVPGEDPEVVTIRQRQTRFDIKGGLNDPLPGFRMAKTRWGYNNHTHTEFEGGEVGTLLLNREWEGRTELLHKPLAGWDGALGMQYQHRQLATSGEEAFVPDSQAEAVSTFALEKLSLNRWHFELGGRYERQSARRREDGLSVEHQAVSLAGGTIWTFFDGYSLGGNLSHTQRAPALEELFSNGPHLATGSYEIGDASLKKEKSNNLDVFMRKREGRFEWTLNLFANLIDDFVFLREVDLMGDGIADRVNSDGALATDGLLLLTHHQKKARFMGVEFETTAQLLNNRRGKLDLRLWTDYTRGRLAGGEPIPRMTPLRFGGALNYGKGPWRSMIDVMHVHKQNRIASLETETGAYTMLNIQMEYAFDWKAGNYSLFVRGANLLDEEARRHTSFLKNRAPLPARSAMVGVRINF